jgi:hypothetical protein
MELAESIPTSIRGETLLLVEKFHYTAMELDKQIQISQI